MFGSLRLIRKDFDEAIRQYKIAAEEDPFSSSLFHNMALAYLCKNNLNKAIKCSRQSVALNPINKDAVILFADLSVELNEKEKNTTKKVRRYEEAITVLDNYINYDPQCPITLERLARVYFLSGNYAETLIQLRKQKILHETSEVLNNLALTYRKMGNRYNAIKHFERALALSQNDNHLDIVNNFAIFLLHESELQAVIKLARKCLKKFNSEEIKADEKLSKIYLTKLIALAELKSKEIDIDFAESVLSSPNLSIKLKYDFVVFLNFYYSTFQPNKVKALFFADIGLSILEGDIALDKASEDALINNIVYTFLEFDELSKARPFLSKIGSKTHKDVFYTATSGFWNIKIGRHGKGENLYKEAIALTDNAKLKDLLRQKMHLELGKALIKETEGNKVRQALSHFKKAYSCKDGYDHFRDEALFFERSIRQKQIGR